MMGPDRERLPRSVLDQFHEKRPIEISPQAKRAAASVDEAVSSFLAKRGFAKETGGQFLLVTEKIIQHAINEALVEILTKIAAETMEDLRGGGAGAKTDA